MKDLMIGQLIRVTKVAEVGYPDGNTRVVTSYDVEPFIGAIVGIARRMLGVYSRASGGYDQDYEPAELHVRGSVLLWEVRRGMTNAPVLVRDEDIELHVGPIINADGKLPKRASKPKRTGMVKVEP